MQVVKKTISKENDFFGTFIKENEYFGIDEFFNYRIEKRTSIYKKENDFKSRLKDLKSTIKQNENNEFFDLFVDAKNNTFSYKVKFENISYTGRNYNIIDANKQIYNQKICIIRSCNNEGLVKIKNFKGIYFYSNCSKLTDLLISNELTENDNFVQSKKNELINIANNLLKINSAKDIILKKLSN